MDEQDTNKNLSTQKVLLPGHDPGWNDPPKWAFSGDQPSTATPTKRVLNKRVAFPLFSAQVSDKESTSQITPMSMNMPPPLHSVNLTTASHPPLTPPSDKGTDVRVSEVELDKNQVLNEALANLQAVIDEHIVEKAKAEEVKKRLHLMKVAWVEDKLNDTIHKNILDISKALQEKNIEQADKIHIALMVQHASLCSSWIPCIRHIILELKAKCQNQDVIQSDSGQPQLLPVGLKEVN